MFLEDQISEQLIMQLPGYIAIQDLDSKYVIANNLTLEALKLNSLDKIMGCKYEDMVFDVATCADVLRQQDQLA